MVQGGLLTTHPGSTLGGGEAPEDQSSLRQGAETGCRALPVLEATWRWNREEYREKRCFPRVSAMGGKYRSKGGTTGGPLLPGDILAPPGVGSHSLTA